MQYVIDCNRLTTSVSFDWLDPETSTIKRRQVILEQRYANKRLVYPLIIQFGSR